MKSELILRYIEAFELVDSDRGGTFWQINLRGRPDSYIEPAAMAWSTAEADPTSSQPWVLLPTRTGWEHGLTSIMRSGSFQSLAGVADKLVEGARDRRLNNAFAAAARGEGGREL